MIETKALGPSARGSGRRSNFSISGKLMSTCGWPVARRWRGSARAGGAASAGRTPGPRTGARLTIASPSCEATQPPTPISTGLPPCLSAFQRPSWLKTFSCAFSRIEQVLTRMTSASSTLVGQFQAVAGGEHVGHLGRVVLVHLAAVGLDEELAARAGPGAGRPGGGVGHGVGPGGAAVNPRRRGAIPAGRGVYRGRIATVVTFVQQAVDSYESRTWQSRATGGALRRMRGRAHSSVVSSRSRCCSGWAGVGGHPVSLRRRRRQRAAT